MSEEKARFEISFFAIEAFKNRPLHFAIRDVAEHLNVVGEMRWHLGCLHEAYVEGEEDKLDAFAVYLNDKVMEQAEELDGFSYDIKTPTGEFNDFKSVFVTSKEEAPVVIPDYVDELNRVNEDSEAQDEKGKISDITPY